MDKRPSMERALSTDVVMDTVLSHLKVEDLLNCRKVSKFWNTAASSMLRRRATMVKTISGETELMKLKECVEQNSDFPFAGLEFDEPWRLNSPRAKQFFKDYGDKFTSLYFGSSLQTRLEDLAPFTNHLPRLSVLDMRPCRIRGRRVKCMDSAVGQEGVRILNLPSLRTFRISAELNQDVLREVFRASSPSLRIECLHTTPEILRALKSFGKLKAVSFMDYYDDEDYYGRADHPLSAATLLSTDSPALTKLDFNGKRFSSQAGPALMKLLISSQNSLQDLSLCGIHPSQFSPECPVLTQMTTLTLWTDNPHEYIFKGNHGYKFPALKELNLGINAPRYTELSDGLFIVPSLTKIDLQSHIDKAGIEDLARSFPNVMEIQLHHKEYDFGYLEESDPIDIWSVGAFKFLEKLEIRGCNVKWSTKNYESSKNLINLKKFKIMNMDSFLTGIPITICENLRKNNQKNFLDNPLHEILRDSPNILQLKNLKELIVSVDLDLEEKWDEPPAPEEPPFISMVSVWYALQMMPNLEARFLYEPRSSTWCFEEKNRDKTVAVLKAAFKHVHLYVELQPFFY